VLSFTSDRPIVRQYYLLTRSRCFCGCVTGASELGEGTRLQDVKLTSLQPVHFASYQLAAGVPPFWVHS
jgi:hypothetical protein